MPEHTYHGVASGSSGEVPSSQIWNNHANMDCSPYQETTLDGTEVLLTNQHRRSDSPTGAVGDGTRGRKSKLTRYQTITLISVSLAVFMNWLTYSVIIVFYPIEAKARGMSQTMVGFVFSAFSIVSMIASPMWGKILPVVRSRFLFLAGCFVAGGCNLLFGFLIDMPPGATFAVFSFLIRIMEGLGSSASITASMAIVAYAFPENIGTALSVLEMVGGASYGIGPALGGLLFDIGGFRLPFFVIGGSVLASVVLNFFVMPQQGSPNDPAGSIFRIARIPAVWFAILGVFSGAAGLSSLYPTLSPYLEKDLNFTVVEAGAAFGSYGVVYSVAAMLWGHIADKKKATRIMMVLGAFFSAVSFLFLGPSPVLLIPPRYGMECDLGNTAIVSGLFMFSQNMGATFGPTIGGTLTDNFGFGYGTSIVACGYVVVMILIAVFSAWEYRCGKRKTFASRTRLVVETSSTETDEKTILNDV